MAGESYAVCILECVGVELTAIYQGRYLPVFAAEIHDRNALLIEAGLAPVNLSSIMIGVLSFICHIGHHLIAFSGQATALPTSTQ